MAFRASQGGPGSERRGETSWLLSRRQQEKGANVIECGFTVQGPPVVLGDVLKMASLSRRDKWGGKGMIVRFVRNVKNEVRGRG
jgi:hypothetical protein